MKTMITTYGRKIVNVYEPSRLNTRSKKMIRRKDMPTRMKNIILIAAFLGWSLISFSQQTQESHWLCYGKTMNELYGGTASTLNVYYLFPDTTALIESSGQYNYSQIHSISSILDVKNENFQFVDGIQWDKNVAFTVDSMSLSYQYLRYTSDQNQVDTLIVYLYHDGYPDNLSTRYWAGANGWNQNFGADTLFTKRMQYNYLTNSPGQNNNLTTPPQGMTIIKVLLTEDDTINGNSFKEKVFSTGSYKIPSGNLVCAAIVFQPGYSYVSGDTLNNGKNIFLFASYEEQGSNTFPYYDKNQWNQSAIIHTTVRNNNSQNGWNGQYIPSYAQTQSWPLEHHLISFKVTSLNIGLEDRVAKRQGLTVYQNYPNPFQLSTTISYELADDGNVVVAVTDLTGRTVFSSEHTKSRGAHKFSLDGSVFGKGIYFYTIRTEQASLTKKMTVIE